LKISNIPGKKFWCYPKFFLRLIIAFFKSLFYLIKQRPVKIVSTGGLIAVPVCLAGKLLRIPIELYELNVIPGKAVRFLSPLAKNIFVIFKKSQDFFKQKVNLCKYPLRFTDNDKIFNKKELLEKLSFDTNKKTIFLTGGSHGSLFLNNIIKNLVIESGFVRENGQIIHQTGDNDKTDWKSFYANHKIPAHVFSYDPNIKDFYLLSDLIICRGGAGTLFEIKFFQKKAIVIPIKSLALGHQLENAIEMERLYPELFSFFDPELDSISLQTRKYLQELSSI